MSLRLMVPLAVTYFVRNYIDQENPDNLIYMRGFAASVVAVLLSAYAMIYFKVQADPKLAAKKLHLKASDLVPPNPLAGALGLPDPNADKPDEIMTAAEYDHKQLRTAVTQLLTQSCIVGFLHFKWEMTLPLITSSVMMLMNISGNPLVRLHLLGADPSKMSADAKAELTRPFKPKSPFGGMMEEYQKALKEAEGPAAKKKALKAEKQAKRAAKRKKAHGN